MTKADKKRLNVFLPKGLHRILKIYWPMCTTNKGTKIRAENELISKQVARRRWAWLVLDLRTDNLLHVRIALTWVPEKKTEGTEVDSGRQGEEQRKGCLRRNYWCSSITLKTWDYFILSRNFWNRKNVLEYFN